jgi:hypothetical protein
VVHALSVTQMDNIQTFTSYNREEIIGFLASYEVIDLRSKDNDKIYQVNFWLPSPFFIIVCLLLPLIMLFCLPVPLHVRITFTIGGILIMPFFLYGFNRYFRKPLKSKMIRFLYDKESCIFNIPHLQLQIARSDIVEFVVISGWHKGDKNNAGNMSISELSIVFREEKDIKRIPLFLSVSKNKAMKIAKKVSEYTGTEYYKKRVTNGVI